MAVSTGTAILGAGIASGIGGAISGGSDQESTKTINLAPAGAQERDLQQRSFQNYLQQQALQNQMEQGIAGGMPLQEAARGSLQGILSGEAFNVSPEMQARIDAARSATVAAGQTDIQKFLNENMGNIMQSGANRNLRGQALSELQGRGVSAAADQYGRLIQGANVTAANQALALPMEQARLQGGFAQTNANFADVLRQQAFQNRQQLQNPALMQALQNERLGAAGATTVQPGSLGGAIGGALGGFGSGAMGGANIAAALRNDAGGMDRAGGTTQYSTDYLNM